MTQTNVSFRECPTCAANPGQPVLCEACRHNRDEMVRLAAELDMQTKTLMEHRAKTAPPTGPATRTVLTTSTLSCPGCGSYLIVIAGHGAPLWRDHNNGYCACTNRLCPTYGTRYSLPTVELRVIEPGRGF